MQQEDRKYKEPGSKPDNFIPKKHEKYERIFDTARKRSL